MSDFSAQQTDEMEIELFLENTEVIFLENIPLF